MIPPLSSTSPRGYEPEPEPEPEPEAPAASSAANGLVIMPAPELDIGEILSSSSLCVGTDHRHPFSNRTKGMVGITLSRNKNGEDRQQLVTQQFCLLKHLLGFNKDNPVSYHLTYNMLEVFEGLDSKESVMYDLSDQNTVKELLRKNNTSLTDSDISDCFASLQDIQSTLFEEEYLGNYGRLPVDRNRCIGSFIQHSPISPMGIDSASYLAKEQMVEKGLIESVELPRLTENGKNLVVKMWEVRNLKKKMEIEISAKITNSRDQEEQKCLKKALKEIQEIQLNTLDMILMELHTKQNETDDQPLVDILTDQPVQPNIERVANLASKVEAHLTAVATAQKQGYIPTWIGKRSLNSDELKDVNKLASHVIGLIQSQEGSARLRQFECAQLFHPSSHASEPEYTSGLDFLLQVVVYPDNREKLLSFQKAAGLDAILEKVLDEHDAEKRNKEAPTQLDGLSDFLE